MKQLFCMLAQALHMQKIHETKCLYCLRQHYCLRNRLQKCVHNILVRRICNTL